MNMQYFSNPHWFDDVPNSTVVQYLSYQREIYNTSRILTFTGYFLEI